MSTPFIPIFCIFIRVVEATFVTYLTGRLLPMYKKGIWCLVNLEETIDKDS